MGMNYYLNVKVDFDPKNPIPDSLGCGDYNYHWDEIYPKKLTNGWVWNNTYYPTVQALNRVFYQRIHIGKSSRGWRFFLCQYPAENPRFKKGEEEEGDYAQRWTENPIETLEDWKKLFYANNTEIYDEEDELINPDEMMKIITERKGEVEADETGWSKRTYLSSVQYRVINGLCVHDETREKFGNPERITIMPDDCTYDLVMSGNDVDYGTIFS